MVFFILFHPLAWGLEWMADEEGTVLTIGPFTLGFDQDGFEDYKRNAR